MPQWQACAHCGEWHWDCDDVILCARCLAWYRAGYRFDWYFWAAARVGAEWRAGLARVTEAAE